MKTLIKAGTGLVLIAGTSFFSACGGDSTSASKDEISTTVEVFDDLPNCTSGHEGDIVNVVEDGNAYICQSGKWSEYKKPLQTYDSEDDLPSCGSKNDGERAIAGQDLFACSDRQWSKVATVYATEEDLPSCTAKRKNENVYITDLKTFMVCEEDEWKEQSEPRQSEDENQDTEEDLSSSTNAKSSSSFAWEDGSSSDAKESSSSVKQKAVEFEKGVLWKPSYGDRVHVFNDGLDEYNFLDDTTRVGKWFTFSDKGGDENGASTASVTYGDNYMTIKHNLVYHNWTRKDGAISPDPNPYAQALIYFSPKNTTADLSAYKGICLEYSSTKEFRLEFQSEGDGEDDFWDVWVPGGEHTVNLEFKNIPVASWRSGNSVSINQALKKMILMSIESPYIDRMKCYATNTNDCKDTTVTNTIKLYKIGEYGECSGDADELGKKRVDFEEDVLWKSSYENKVRTFFGAVDEYNFMTDDVSGWWFTYSDTSNTTDNGQSTVRKTLKSSGGYLEINLSLIYDRWKKDGTNIIPSPYPYAAFGFNWTSANEDGFADLSLLGEGLCLDYTAEKSFDMILYVYQDQDRWQTTIPASSVRKVINVKFGDAADMGDFFRYDWQSGAGLPFETIVKQVTGLHFEMNGQHAGSYVDWCTEEKLDADECEKQTVTNTIKLYKLGKYGACD